MLYFLYLLFICKMSSSRKHAFNKIKQEMQKIRNNQSYHYSVGLFISLVFSLVVCLNHYICQRKFSYCLFTAPVDASNLFVWQGIIKGLENSPYTERMFPVAIRFLAKYPCKPMRVIYFWPFAKLVHMWFFNNFIWFLLFIFCLG